MQSGSAPLATRTNASGIPCTGSSYPDNSGMTYPSKKGSRAQSEGAELQIPTHRTDMKDEENSLATDTMAILQCTTLPKIVLDAEFSMQINPNYIKIIS